MIQLNITFPRSYFATERDVTHLGESLADSLAPDFQFWGDIFNRDTICFAFYTETPHKALDLLRTRSDTAEILSHAAIAAKDSNDTFVDIWPNQD